MSMDFNANQYRGRGLPYVDEQDGLGCIMLDTAEPALTAVFDHDDDLAADLRRAEHVTDQPDRYWIKGLVGAHDTSHVTLLYGLLPQVRREHVDVVLDGWHKPRTLHVSGVGVFPSPYPDEPYACIVAHLELDPLGALAEAHERLSMLPHIDTHALYRAHVTLGYVTADGSVLEGLVRRLDQALAGNGIPTGELNYGKNLR